MENSIKLENKHCIPCEGGTPPLEAAKVIELLKQLSKNWKVNPEYKQIYNDFHFENYNQTIAFVNAVAEMTNKENHHPDLEVGYNHCLVRYSTHAINGLSENDFICAKKVDAIYLNHSASQNPT